MYKPKVKAPNPELLKNVQRVLTNNNLTTVCEEAACPNRAECYQRNATTFMILGDTCTRACGFCNVKTGKGNLPDASEPERLAKAVKELGLVYVVITSVDRDDLKDYGSQHFSNCVYSIRKQTPDVKIELLTPDFKADKYALDTIINAAPEKLAHNQECVERLSPTIRPQSSYKRSLEVLEYYAKNSNAVIKSSLMLGLGESEAELHQTMQDLLNAGVEELTLGQYLQPTQKHHKVEKYYPQSFFDSMKIEALSMGFKAVASGILVRSSYFADVL
jgi:lipoic acid synthetase